MSSESIIALVAVIASGVLGVTSLAFSFWNSSSERRQRLNERKEEHREWYRRTLFEKRMQVVQQAYAWWRRLNEAVTKASSTRDPSSSECDVVRGLAKEAREWYDSNSAYLEQELTGSSAFVGLTNAAYTWASGRDDIDIHASLNEVYEFVGRRADHLLAWEDGGETEVVRS